MTGFFDLTARGFIGEGRLQLEELVLAFILSSLVGLERELRQKSAGLRTHTLVNERAGEPVVHELIAHWATYRAHIPGQN